MKKFLVMLSVLSGLMMNAHAKDTSKRCLIDLSQNAHEATNYLRAEFDWLLDVDYHIDVAKTREAQMNAAFGINFTPAQPFPAGGQDQFGKPYVYTRTVEFYKDGEVVLTSKPFSTYGGALTEISEGLKTLGCFN